MHTNDSRTNSIFRLLTGPLCGLLCHGVCLLDLDVRDCVVVSVVFFMWDNSWKEGFSRDWQPSTTVWCKLHRDKGKILFTSHINTANIFRWNQMIFNTTKHLEFYINLNLITIVILNIAILWYKINNRSILCTDKWHHLLSFNRGPRNSTHFW